MKFAEHYSEKYQKSTSDAGVSKRSKITQMKDQIVRNWQNPNAMDSVGLGKKPSWEIRGNDSIVEFITHGAYSGRGQ